MGFSQSYKELDNLCKDLLRAEKGVSSYIEEMENKRNFRYKSPNWNNDLAKLKHYRHIRNQIAHDNYATEENMTDLSDVAWVDYFHESILSRKDPLSLYRQAEQQILIRQTQPSNITRQPVFRSDNFDKPQSIKGEYHNQNKKKKSNIHLIFITIIALILFASLIYILLL